MLNTLDDYERMNIADALISKSFPDGYAVIKQGLVSWFSYHDHHDC